MFPHANRRKPLVRYVKPPVHYNRSESLFLERGVNLMAGIELRFRKDMLVFRLP